jgi:Apea-like HEPN
LEAGTIFQKVFENIIELTSRNTTSFSPTFVNPATDLSPNLKADAIQMLSQSSVNLQALPENIQNRVKLSLRWYSKSLKEADIDGFLSIWIAIEVIGMPDTSNVKPAIELLAKIYQLDYRTAVNRFQLGRIQDLRSKVVHEGKIFTIHYFLTKYLEAIYIDLLIETLGLPHERRTEAILDSQQFNLGKLINRNQI